MTQLAWFALYSAYRAEFRAAEVIRDLAKEWDKIGRRLDVYCPREKVFRRHQGRKHKVTLPLFPRYVFVGLEPDTHGDMPIAAMTGLAEIDGVVGVRGAPLQIPYELPDPETARARRGATPEAALSIRQLREMEEEGLFDHTARKRREPAKGESVEITGGKFQGWPATFEAMNGEDRARVLVNMFKRWTPLDLKTEEITWSADEPSEAPPKAA